MSKYQPQLATDRRGASAAEFAMVMPLLVLLLFAIIDGGRYVWEVNRAEKATQIGARMAVVTNVISTDLRDESFVGAIVGGDTVDPGETIPAAALGEIVCNSAGCTCSGACTGIGTAADAAAFSRLVTRMQQIKPDIGADNVEVVYRGSGLGFAGDPTGMSMSPLVTVRLKDIQFRPITSLLFATMTLPSFATTLTAEDSVGSLSN